MKCNCNDNGGALERPRISHVYGNVLRIAIPLTLRSLIKDGDEMISTDTDFIPSNEYPVKVVFAKSALKYSLDATMNGNIAYVEDKGKIPLGTYDITVTCNDDNGNPYRFNQATVLQVVNSTREAGIATPIEYEVTTWYLDAAIYLALKGEDGVGIEDIRTETSSEIGGVNTVTIYLTDGRTKSFSVMNGSGSVDNILNILSHHPISNSAVTAKFNEIDARLNGLFGDVDYDSQSKEIRFWDKGKASILARLDARPFIKDGMVSNVYISNNTLVITFNTDSGREAIGVPLSSVFNPNNYYTKVQVDNRLASLLENYYTRTQIDNKLSDKASINGDWVQDFTASCFKLWCTERNDGLAVKIDADVDHSPDSAFIVFIDEYNYGGRLIYVFPQDDETRHIATEEYVQEYVSEHEGEGGSLEQVQSDWNVVDTNSPAYIKNKPTIPVIPNNVSYFTNDAGYLTQHQDISGKVDKVTGKGLSTNDYTDADKEAVGTIGSKANSSDVYDKQTVDDMVDNAGTVKTVSVNGGTPVQPVDGNVNLPNIPTKEYVDGAISDIESAQMYTLGQEGVSVGVIGNRLCLVAMDSATQTAAPTITTAIQNDGTALVTITAASGAAIKYSLDEGTTWLDYSQPVTISEVGTHVIMAKATADGELPSSTVTATATTESVGTLAIEKTETSTTATITATCSNQSASVAITIGQQTQSGTGSASLTINKTDAEQTLNVSASATQANKIGASVTESYVIGTLPNTKLQGISTAPITDLYIGTKHYTNDSSTTEDGLVIDNTDNGDNTYTWTLDFGSLEPTSTLKRTVASGNYNIFGDDSTTPSQSYAILKVTQITKIPTFIEGLGNNWARWGANIADVADLYRMKVINSIYSSACTALTNKEIVVGPQLTSASLSYTGIKSFYSEGNLVFENSAFSHCAKMETFIAPNSTGTSSGDVWSGCTKLKRIELGNVTQLNASVFKNASALEVIILKATTPPTVPNTNPVVFTNLSANVIFYVPDSAVNTYKTAWPEYDERIKGISELPAET